MLLEINDLAFAYGKRELFSGVSALLKPGAVNFLAGPNGAGKSTLLKLLCGYLTAQCGSVKLDGCELKSLSNISRAKKLGVVWQSIAGELDFTVREIVTVLAGARFPRLGRLSAEDNLRLDEVLAKFGLEKLADHAFNTLSGGERQKAALAGAWALEPDVLLLDEPTSALDPAWRNKVMDYLEEYAAAHTVLMITHDLELLGRARNQVWLLDNAGNFYSGSHDSVLTVECLSQVYAVPAKIEFTADCRRRIYFD